MISSFSVKRPMTIAVAVVIAILLGAIAFTSITVDLLPEMELPYLVVITTYPGASPERVEATVTRPLEEVLATTSGVEEVTSSSQEHSSMIVLQFTQDTNMDSAMLEVSGNIDLVSGAFDDKVTEPVIMRMNPDMLPVMVSTVDREGMDVTELSAFLEENVLPEFERIPGIASVDASGMVEKEVRVTLSQEKIDALNDRVLRSIDEGLADAEGEMRSARQELEGQKRALNQKGQEGISGLVSSGQKLQQGKDQLQSGSLKLSDALENLNTSLKEAQEKRAQLVQARDALEKRPELEAGLAQAEAGISQLESGLAGVDNALAALQSQYEAAVGAGDAATAEALAGQIQAQQAARAELEGQLAAARSQKSQLEAALQQLDALAEQGITDTAAADAMIAKADEGISQLEAGIAEVKRQQAELEKSKGQLQSGETQLEQGKLTMTQELTKASVLLSLGEQQLDEAEEELEKNRDAAYDQAGLDGKITQTTIASLLTAQNFAMPAGSVAGADREDVVLKVGDEFSTLEELEQTVLFEISQGEIGPVRLSDVADVTIGDNTEELFAKVNNNDGVILMFSKQSTASTAEVCHRITAAAEELEAEYAGLHVTALSDQGMYIDLVIDSVLENLGFGALLAVVILLLFLRSFRPTLIVACSIPVSLMAAVALMYFTGVSMNMISLSGLALAVGMLVDNSIVVIENVYRLRQQGVDRHTAAVYGAKQVAGAIAASTLTTVCVFLPIVFTDGISRQLFTDMGLTIAYALVASLAVALTLVPVMSAGLLKKAPKEPGRIYRGLVRGYGRALGWSLRHKAVVLILAAVLVPVSFLLETTRGTAFMPEMETPQLSVSFEMPEEATERETQDMAVALTDRLLTVPEVETVGVSGSSGAMGMMTGSGGSSGGMTMYVVLREDKTRSNAEIIRAIEDAAEGLDCTVSASGSGMDISMLSGEGVSVSLKGDDLDTLRDLAAAAGEKLAALEGIAAVDDGQEQAAPEVRVTVDKNAAMRYGLTVAQVYQQLAAKIPTDTSATTVTLENETYPVIVASGGDQETLTRENLERTTLTGTVDGEEQEVPLTDLAEVGDDRGFTSIRREDQVRTVNVSATLKSGYNIGLVAGEAEAALAELELPAGYRLEMGGENETIQQSMSDLVLMVALAIVFIYLIMVAQFQSLLSPFIVLFTIPLAFTGGLLGLYLCGMELSVIAMLGFLVLAGIIVNNGIVFVDYANQLRLEGMEKRQALLETGTARLRPILMTALTTVFGLSTMALGLGMGGGMVQPMAVVAVGGLLYATLLTLFVVPCLYDLFHRKEMKKVEIQEVPEEHA